MSPSFLRKMNELMSPNLEDWSDSLVGKVKQELRFSERDRKTMVKRVFTFYW